MDSRYQTPVSIEFLYKVRYRLRTEGVFEKIKRDKKEEETVADEDEAEAELPAGDETIMQTEEKEVDPSDEREEKEPPGSVPPTGRPEWEVLTPSARARKSIYRALT